jgi:anti-sigma B factor antagonist
VERSSGAAPPLSFEGTADREDGRLLTIHVEAAASNLAIVSLTGELDLSTIPRVEKRLLRELRSNAGVVVDLTRVSFIDSSGIGLLIHAFRAGDGGTLHIVIAEGTQVDRVFRLAGIDRALPLFVARDGALEALNGGVSG